LRRHLRRVTTFAVVMGAIALALAFAPAGQAAEVKHGDPNYTLPAGENIHTDLIVFGDSSTIDGDVEGDVISWSRSLTINGHVKGDVIAFSQTIRVNGPVGGNVRVFCQSLFLENVVTRNVMAWAGDLTLNEKAKIDGSLTVGSGDAELNGELTGDLLAGTGDLTINGLLDRNALIHSGKLVIGPKAEIKGQVKYHGRQQPETSSTAKLGSPIEVTIEKRHSDTSYSSPHFYWHQILLWGASFVFGLAMLLLMPGFFFDAAGACKRTMPAIGFGALFLIALPILGIIVCITIVGIGVGIAALMFWVIAIYAAQVIVGTWLGDQLLGETVGVGPALGRMALGLLILRVIGRVPYLGVWFSSLVICLGLGAIVLAIYRNMRPHLATAAVI
jgi:cytoskeletal protein CcmA (bactofilin family)